MRIAFLAAAAILLILAPASAMAAERTIDESCDPTSTALGHCSRVLAIDGQVFFEFEVRTPGASGNFA